MIASGFGLSKRIVLRGERSVFGRGGVSACSSDNKGNPLSGRCVADKRVFASVLCLFWGRTDVLIPVCNCFFYSRSTHIP